MRLFDPATWRLLAWCKDRLPPSEFVVDRDNFGVQLRCVTTLATLAGPPPSGVKLRDAGWASLSACGWEWDSISGPSATARWSRLTSDNTVGPSSYPPGTVAADIQLPDVTLSLGG